VKRISIGILLITLFFCAWSLGAEIDFNRPAATTIASITPDSKIMISVNYPAAEPVQYTGIYVADLEDAVLISVSGKLFFIRKQFIQSLVILPEKYKHSLAMNSPDH